MINVKNVDYLRLKSIEVTTFMFKMVKSRPLEEKIGTNTKEFLTTVSLIELHVDNM